MGLSTGASNLTGERIPFFERSFNPRSSGIFEGAAVVATSDTDNLMVDLPTSAAALNGGRNFVGISAAAGTTVVTNGASLPDDNQLPVQMLGVAKAALKANTACVKYAPAGYNPADGGYIVPHVDGLTVYIGRFTQTKSAAAVSQMVGVWLDGGAGTGEQLVGVITSSSAAVTNTAVETAFDKTLSLPANLVVSSGSVLRVQAKVNVLSGNAADTLTLRLKLGTQVLALTAAVDVTDGGGDLGILRAELTFRTVGSSASVVAMGEAGLGAPAALIATVRVAGVAGTFVVNTTAAQTLSVTAQWSAASVANQAVLENFTATLLRAGA